MFNGLLGILIGMIIRNIYYKKKRRQEEEVKKMRLNRIKILAVLYGFPIENEDAVLDPIQSFEDLLKSLRYISKLKGYKPYKESTEKDDCIFIGEINLK